MAACVAAAAFSACGGGDDKGGLPGAEDRPPAIDAVPEPAGGAGGIRLEQLPGVYKEPTYVTSPPRDPSSIVILERSGVARVVRNGRLMPRSFFDVQDEVQTKGAEQGAMSIAFAPDYARSGRLYVFFTDLGDDLRIVEIRRSSSSPNEVDPASERLVMRIHHPTTTPPGSPKVREDLRVHNGGQLAFGPDGMLYAGTGDGGGQGDPADRAQDLHVLLGKVLRIDPRPAGGRPYRIPTDNPFLHRAGARPEIWAYGLRNPYRFSFDRKTHDLVIGDVGQYQVEEIDFLPADSHGGANFGWSCFEGTRRFKPCDVPGKVDPIIQLASSGVAKRCAAVTGGYVVRDPGLPSLNGRYLYADFCVGKLRSAFIRDGRVTDDKEVGMTVPWPSTFGEDAAGRIYVTSYYLGRVYRINAM